MCKIAAVVVTYNRKDLLSNCIECVLNQTKGEPDVLVIDNASTDGTKEMIDSKFSNNRRVLYKNTGSNIGGAGGFSFGINVAVNMGYDYLWIMDDDTFACDTALEELLNAAQVLNDDFGFLASYVKWTDGSPCIMNLPRVNIEWYSGNIEQQFDNSMIMVESSSFVSMFIRSSVVRAVGLPIKEFFIWSDDVEYTLRISSRYNSYFVYPSQVTHATKVNSSPSIVDEQNTDRLERYVYLYRNKYYIAKHISFKARLAYFLEFHGTVLRIIRYSTDNKAKRIGKIYKGYIRGVFFNPRIEKVHE